MDHNQAGPDDASERIGRRDALRRGATIGAGAIWAVPIVQSIGKLSAFAQTSPVPPPPPPPPPPPSAEFPSNIELLLKYGGVVYGFKYDEFDSATWDWQPFNTPGSSQCLVGETWTKPTDAMLAYWNANVAPSKSVNANGFGVYTVTIPSGYQYRKAYAKCGTACPPGVSLGGSSYSFSCG